MTVSTDPSATDPKPDNVAVGTHVASDPEKIKDTESLEEGETYYSRVSVWLMLIFMSVATGSDS